MKLYTLPLLSMLVCLVYTHSVSAQNMPLVYDVENTCTECIAPELLHFDDLPEIPHLPNPFRWADGRGTITNFGDWKYRRAEIGTYLQHYGIGEKPNRPEEVDASYQDGVLTVNITVAGNTLTLTSNINLPDGEGPFPAVIGMGSGSGSLPDSIFIERDIARIPFNFGQVMAHTQSRGLEPFNQLYPELDHIGSYSAWPWGVSRLIDGLELVADDLNIDLERMAVTGCSFAGKMALYAGALDERIALTISQESGGGGYTSWRYNQTMSGVENLGNTNSAWFSEDLIQFSGNVAKLPYDHHELMAMVAPRALMVIGNPGQVWMADESGYVASRAAEKVWDALEVPERFGYSITGGHNHCAVPDFLRGEIEEFVDKFLMGIETADTNIRSSVYDSDLEPWITWDTPTLVDGTPFMVRPELVFPKNEEINVETSTTLRWNNVEDAAEYEVQINTTSTFNELLFNETLVDTFLTLQNLEEGVYHNWRVRVKNANDIYGPWTEPAIFGTKIDIPGKIETAVVDNYSPTGSYVRFTWGALDKAQQYRVDLSKYPDFEEDVKSTVTANLNASLYGVDVETMYYWRIRGQNISGNGPWSDVEEFTIVSTGIMDEGGIPSHFSLAQNYPNPFNPTTTISFGLPQTADVQLHVYNLLGQRVETLVSDQLSAGFHNVVFDASHVSSGVYFYTLRAGDFMQSRKLSIIK